VTGYVRVWIIEVGIIEEALYFVYGTEMRSLTLFISGKVWLIHFIN